MAGQFALERMKPPAGQTHVLRAGGCIQLRQLPPQPGSVGGQNAGLAATEEERFEAFVSERSNHMVLYSETAQVAAKIAVGLVRLCP